MTQIDEQEERFKERFLNASFSFWNSLITLNAIIIGAIAILLSINPDISLCFVISVFLFGILSIILIVWNFLVVKNVYGSISTTEKRHENTQTDKLDESFAKDIKKTLKQRDWVNIREKLSLVLTTLGIVIIFILIIAEYK